MLPKFYPKVHRRYALLPVVVPILEGFGTWLLKQGYSMDVTLRQGCVILATEEIYIPSVES
jgi:hypothetical protein